MKINPFHHLGSTKKYPFTNLYTRTFRGRLADAWRVMAGSVNFFKMMGDGAQAQHTGDKKKMEKNMIEGKYSDFGLLDYLLVFPIIVALISRFEAKLNSYLKCKNKALYYAVRILMTPILLPIALANLGVTIAKWLVASALTLTIGLLSAAIAHPIMKWMRNRKLRQLNDTPITSRQANGTLRTTTFAKHPLSKMTNLSFKMIVDNETGIKWLSYRGRRGGRLQKGKTLEGKILLSFALSHNKIFKTLFSINYDNITETLRKNEESYNDPSRIHNYTDMFNDLAAISKTGGRSAQAQKRFENATLSSIDNAVNSGKDAIKPLTLFFAANHKGTELSAQFANEQKTVPLYEEGRRTLAEVQRDNGYLPELHEDIHRLIAENLLDGILPGLPKSDRKQVINFAWHEAMNMEKIRDGEAYNAMVATPNEGDESAARTATVSAAASGMACT